MNTKNLPNFIVPVIYLSMALVGEVGLSARLAHSDTANSEGEQIVQLVLKDQILTPVERDELSRLVDEFLAQGHDPEALNSMAVQISLAVGNTVSRLEGLLRNLEKLAINKHAGKIGSMAESDLKDCWNQLDKLQTEVNRARSLFEASQERNVTRHYARIIQESSRLVTGEGEAGSIPDLWESIQKSVKPVYSVWNREFVGLRGKLSKYQKDLRSSSDILTFDESQFMFLFSAAQSSLWKFSESNSSDF